MIANVIWQKKFAPQNDAKLIDADHDHILIFGKDGVKTAFNYLPRTEAMDARYKNPDNDPRGPWTSGDSLRKEFREYAYYEITTPSGRKVLPPPGSSWRFNKEELPVLIADNRLWFGSKGNGVPRIKRFLSDVRQGVIPQTVWAHTQAGHTQDAKKEIIKINEISIFDTPKPEKLLQQVLEIATNPGDLVLDSFLGSGTTAAVAHKMGRRYIGIEIGDHALTHCIPRLQKVMDGEQGGISKAVNWQGGGGFRFYRLGEPIFAEDGSIRPGITFAQLAAHVWFAETGIPLHSQPATPLLGVYESTACYLLFNGILKDKRAHGGNVLTQKILNSLPPHNGPRVIYGERSLFGATRLKEWDITFKQTPYDIKGR